MKKYLAVIEIGFDDRGINGSKPTRKRVKEFLLRGISLGRIEGIPVKATQLEVVMVFPTGK